MLWTAPRSEERRGDLWHMQPYPIADLGVQNVSRWHKALVERNSSDKQAVSRITCCGPQRSEEHTSELQSRFGISYAVFCLKKKKHIKGSTVRRPPPLSHHDVMGLDLR